MLIKGLKYIVLILIVVLAIGGGITLDRLHRDGAWEVAIKSLGTYLSAVGVSTIAYRFFFKEKNDQLWNIISFPTVFYLAAGSKGVWNIEAEFIFSDSIKIAVYVLTVLLPVATLICMILIFKSNNNQSGNNI
jgi:RsiW-degrading membrane proteinase PrsW (M82 family)